MVSTNTKEKILTVASELFGQKGFDGVSIRDIANKAEVNVAAINYHFTNKKLLYQEVFISSFEWIETGINNIASDDSTSLEQLAWGTLRLFLDNGMAMINMMRIFLSDELDMPQNFHEEHCHEGPPGGEVFLRILTQEVGESVPLYKRQWGVRMIFSNIAHLGLVINTKYMKDENHLHDWMTEENLKNDTRELVEAITQLLITKYNKNS